MKVRQFVNEDSARWDAFVNQHAAGSPFHLQAWRRVIQEVFPYEPMYLLAEDKGAICGVLPLVYVRNILIKKALISTPFAVYGGILAASREAGEALYAEAETLGEKLGVQYIELRNARAEQCISQSNVDRYVTFIQEIGPTEQAIVESIPRRTKYMVRKALKHDYHCRITRELGFFERLYAESLRRLGTPCFPHKYFEAVLKYFGNNVDVREYELDGKPASAVLTFYFRDQILPYYGASNSLMNQFAPNNYMYFDLMRWGAENGYRTFDFGRSKRSTGSYEFKSHWGMRERPLPYEMILVKRKRLPNFNPGNPIFQIPMRIWRRLPLHLTRALGPSFLKLVP